MNKKNKKFRTVVLPEICLDEIMRKLKKDNGVIIAGIGTITNNIVKYKVKGILLGKDASTGLMRHGLVKDGTDHRISLKAHPDLKKRLIKIR